MTGQISLPEYQETQGYIRSPDSRICVCPPQTNYLKTQLSQKCIYLFIYFQLLKFPLTWNSWNNLLIGYTTFVIAFLQAVLNSTFRMVLLKPKSFSLLLLQ